MIYVQVILPLAIRQLPTYYADGDLADSIEIGKRVEVQFGKKRRYSGIVYHLQDHYDGLVKAKPVLAVLDDHPVVHGQQINIWEWIADYYCCTIGEVMQAALPSSLKLQSESKVVLNDEIAPNEWTFNDAENIILESLYHQNEMTIDQIDGLIPDQNVYPIIKSLFDRGLVIIKEQLKETSRDKTRTWVSLADPYSASEDHFLLALEDASRSKLQTRALLALFELSKKGPVERLDLQKKARIDLQVLRALEKKKIILLDEKPFYEVLGDAGLGHHIELSPAQQAALSEVRAHLSSGHPVLLNGVTGSGKTHLYIERIKEVMASGKQALFLLPEIALTTQVVSRLKAVFGEKVIAYHSRMNDRERVAKWKAVYHGHPVILGARSSLLLPFKDLKLIVVDEEHDPSYKQHDPAPRYQARDLAIYLNSRYDIDIILGSATPSLESQWNVHMNKYGLVMLRERHGEVTLPEIELIDLKKEIRNKNLLESFSKHVLDEIEKTIESGQQVLVFQNRRGYAPVASCSICAWHSECRNCDVSLTYHKIFKVLRCHYCGYREPIPTSCPSCGNPDVNYRGFGTERIEDELKIHFPSLRIARMDFDTASGRKAREKLIDQMESGAIDILVGTQMITKGLDFDHIGLVVVVNADQLLHYPNFRTNERSYQMLQQLSGRAGRKKLGSKVLIQAFDTDHPVLHTLLNQREEVLYTQELKERQSFYYPPYFRLIQIEAKHKKPEVVRRAMEELADRMKAEWGKRVLGPAEPSIARIRGQFIQHLLIKMEKRYDTITAIKKHLQNMIDETRRIKGLSSVRFNINVDP